MINFQKIVAGNPLPPYFADSADIGLITSALRSAGFGVVQCNRADIFGERPLLARIGAHLLFPEYFGVNWDAFLDCVGSMRQDGVGPTALLLTNIDHMYRENPHGFARSVHILEETSELVRDSASGFQFEVCHFGTWRGIDRLTTGQIEVRS